MGKLHAQAALTLKTA